MDNRNNFIGGDGWDYSKHTTGENFTHGFFHPLDYQKSVEEMYTKITTPTTTQKIGQALLGVTEVAKPVVQAADTVITGTKNFIANLGSTFKILLIVAIVVAVVMVFKK